MVRQLISLQIPTPVLLPTAVLCYDEEFFKLLAGW